MKYKILYIIYLLVFVSCPVLGQVNDPVEKLANGSVNDSGTAATYSITSEGRTTINLYHTQNKKLLQFSGIHADMILTDDIWLGWNFMEKTLYRVDLNTWTKEIILGVDRYKWFPETGSLLVFDKGQKTLELYDDLFKCRFSAEDVHSYEVSTTNNSILILIEDNSALLLKLDGKKLKEVSLNLDLAVKEVKKIKWNPFDLKFYLFKTDSGNLEVVQVTDKEVRKLMRTPLTDTKHSYIDTNFRNLEFIDKHQVLFGVKAISTPSNGVSQVWLGSSKGITPQIRKMYANNLQAAVIDLGTGTKTSLFEKGKLNSFKIHPNSGIVYSYEKNGLEDFTKQFPPINVYEHDLTTGEKRFLGEFRGRSQYFLTSGLSNDLFYFKENEWYSYNGKTKVHAHITKDMEHKFYDVRHEYFDGTDFMPNQYLASYKNKWLVFESLSDIWLYDPVSGNFHKKTEGILQKRKYSLTASSKKATYNILYWSGNVKIDDKDIVLSWQSDDFENGGLSLLKESGKIQDLIETNGQFSQLAHSQRYLTYVKEKADYPPALYMLDKGSRREQLIYQTNKSDTVVTKTKYFKWKSKLGEERGAVVRFPKNYDPSFKYPAVVNIYQKKYMLRNDYAHISQLASGSINYRRYTEDGYFVIEPDIYYELGATGQSAYSCVNDAVDQVLLHTSIDPGRIGIVGHSFGGYQTNFILTQTDRFNAAVSSSGVFDLEAMYLTMNIETLKPDLWRLENQQFRMGKGMYDDRELYRKNSPSVFAENITTPVLIVTGGTDYQVNYQQSYMMFVALKRLNKDANLLLYPSEAHTIEEPNARQDYNIKIKEWFDYRLKETKKPEWLIEGLQ